MQQERPVRGGGEFDHSDAGGSIDNPCAASIPDLQGNCAMHVCCKIGYVGPAVAMIWVPVHTDCVAVSGAWGASIVAKKRSRAFQ